MTAQGAARRGADATRITRTLTAAWVVSARLAARRDLGRRWVSLLCVLALALFAVRAIQGLTLLEFGDESEQYVGAMLIRHGQRLYRDFFGNHGPLAYLLAWIMTFIFGIWDFRYTRLVVILLAAMVGAAVGSNTAVPAGRDARPAAAILFFVPISSLWYVHPLNMLIYHALVGYFMAVMLALLVMPALAGTPVRAADALLSGAGGLLAIASAYTAVAPVGLCVLSAMLAVTGRDGWPAAQRMLVRVAAGAAAAAVPVAVWITFYASWSGLAAYHLYFNQVIYARVMGYSSWSFLNNLNLSVAPEYRVHAFAVCIGAIGLLCAWRSGPGKWMRAGALIPAALALVALNPKGNWGFPDTPQIICAIVVMAIALGAWIGRSNRAARMAWLMAACIFLVSGEMVARTAVGSPWRILRSQAANSPFRAKPDDPLYAEIRRLVHPDEPMLALEFVPAVYIWSGRMPVSGDFYYVPWLAEYDRAPVLGHSIDFCGDIARVQPPVIFLVTGPGLWGTLFSYKPCFGDVLKQYYVPEPKFGVVSDQPVLWVRRDRAP